MIVDALFPLLVFDEEAFDFQQNSCEFSKDCSMADEGVLHVMACLNYEQVNKEDKASLNASVINAPRYR